MELRSDGWKRKTGLYLLCLLSAGCQDPGSEEYQEAAYERITQECADLATTWSPTMSVYEVYDEMSADCAQVLGDSVGLDWASFDLLPGQVDKSGAGTYVLAGLYTLTMGWSATRAELLEDAMMPLVFREELRLHGDDEASSGAVWLSVMQGWVSSITYGGSLAELYDYAVGGYYLANTRTVVVGEVLHTWAGSVSPAYSAAFLIHEASHGFVGHHSPCTSEAVSGLCDPTIEGANGIEVWWIHNWMLAYDEVLTHPECAGLEYYKMWKCWEGIENYASDWEPCDQICQ